MVKIIINQYNKDGNQIERAEKYVYQDIEFYRELLDALNELYDMEPIEAKWMDYIWDADGAVFGYCGHSTDCVKGKKTGTNEFSINVRSLI